MHAKFDKYSDKRLLFGLLLQFLTSITTALLTSTFLIVTAVRADTPYMRFSLWGVVFCLILPLCVIIAIINYVMFRVSISFFHELLNAIERVADGDFDVELSEKRAGPFRTLNRNFNKMSRELRSVSVLRNDFINGFSHEFKTPIVSINGFAELLLESDVSDEERNGYLRIIADESARLAELANSTLLLTRLDTQEIVTERRLYSLDEQIRNCVIILSGTWENKGITVSGELEEIQYNGCEELTQHIWLNLISNAVKFTPEHGEIEITLHQVDSEIIAVIADTGIGMDEETRLHAFDRYYQGKSPQTAGSLGLGLSIVKRIVDLCGGTIEVESEINEGSVFTVTLPVR